MDKVGAAQSNVATDVTNVLKQVGQIEKSSATDAQKTVYQIQGSVNQILNKLPFVSKDPVFYGMMVHDIYSQIPKTGFDLELLGLNLTDSDLGHKAPVITVSGETIPSADISVQEDRVQVVLPDSVKQKIGFKDDFCAAQSSFPVSMQVFYQTSKTFAFIPIHTATSQTFNAFALKGPDQFVAKITTSGETTIKTSDVKTFQVKSGQVTYGCEDNNSGATSYKVPDGATDVNCTASWVDQIYTKTQSASCAVGGTTVTASGTVRGVDKNCTVTDVLSGGLIKIIVGRNTACNCPGGGHAALLLQGTYKLPNVSEQPFTDGPIQQTFLNESEVSLPSDQTKRITAINVDLTRPQCDKTLDTIKMNLPTDSTAIASQTSDNGLFKATYRAEHLHIEENQ